MTGDSGRSKLVPVRVEDPLDLFDKEPLPLSNLPGSVLARNDQLWLGQRGRNVLLLVGHLAEIVEERKPVAAEEPGQAPRVILRDNLPALRSAVLRLGVVLADECGDYCRAVAPDDVDAKLLVNCFKELRLRSQLRLAVETWLGPSPG